MSNRRHTFAKRLPSLLPAAQQTLMGALDNSVALLAALLAANCLRVYYRGWLADALFGLVLVVLGCALLRDWYRPQSTNPKPVPRSPSQPDARQTVGLTEPRSARPKKRIAWAERLWTWLSHGARHSRRKPVQHRPQFGAAVKTWLIRLSRHSSAARERRARHLILTPFAFAVLIAAYGFGLFHEFTGQGFRNLAAIVCAAAVFIFCYARAPALARSKATAALVATAAVALLPTYLTDIVIHAHMFAAMLGYAFLTVGIVLAARTRSLRTQGILAHGALLAALVFGVIYGSRAQVLVTVLAYGFYWASRGLLKSRHGSLALASCAGIVVGTVVVWFSSPRSEDVMRRFDEWGWNYTGSGLSTGRETLFRATLAGIVESPWWGHGPGADITDFPVKTDAEVPTDHVPDGALCMSGSPPDLLRDCRTLLEVRNTLAGETPQSLWHWNFNVPLDQWSGVFIAGQPPRVTRIELEDAKLMGRIPPELAALDQLEVLVLDTNHLSGPIPPELGGLTQLRTLSLSNNALSGSVPESLGKLSNLQRLDLSHNQLRGTLPATLAEIGHLGQLKLAGNMFSGHPPEALYAVGEHDLYEGLLCQVTLGEVYPDLFEDCSALLAGRDVLAGEGALNWSRVAPIHTWRGVHLAGTPPRVEHLDLTDAGLNGRIPKEFSRLQRLKVLKLNANRLRGEIPWSLGLLSDLSEVRLAGNDFTGAPPAPLFRVASNDLRDMLYCASTGTINDELLRDCETLLGLKDTLAGDAVLNWRRSEPLGWWRGVQLDGEPLRIVRLTLHGSELNGRLPPALGDLDQLTTLHLAGNELVGTLPAELGRLSLLRDLRLDPPVLAHGAPTALCRLEALMTVLADACQQPAEPNPGLRGDRDALLAAREHLDSREALNWHPDRAIEAWDGVVLDGNPSRVVAVLLGGRGLAGQVSPALGRLDELVELSLARNRLQGTIPPELGQLTRLEALNLAHNALQGAIPPQLGSLTQLLALNLEGNRLTDVVPDELATLPHLALLRLADNDFVGDMPADLREVPDHDIDQDLFCLPLPRGNSAQLRDCRTLLAVRDELAGDGELNWRTSTPIGVWQGVILGGNPTRVVALELAEMGLTGRIPKALGRLTALRSLVLDGNALTGFIPAEVGNLKRLPMSQAEGHGLSRSLTFTWSSRVSAATPASAVMPLGIDEDRGTWPVCGFAGASSALMADCRALLEARDALAGSGSLNWSRTLPVAAWEGVSLGATLPPRVVALDLAGFGLTGRIPAALSQLSRLVALRLNDNGLHGEVPATLGHLANLEALWLNDNALTGTLPQALGTLPKLRVVRLAGNRFSGPLPTWQRTVDHDLDKALFCLPLPEINAGLLQDCNALLAARAMLSGGRALNWRRNLGLGDWRGVELGGEPPRVIGLDISGLGLDGQVPPELGALTELRRLELGGNALTGPIPDALAQLAKLETLRLFRQPDSLGITENLAPTEPIVDVIADAEPRLGAPPCASDNPGLLADCELLLAIRKTLAGNTALNWRRTLPVEDWEGVSVAGTPPRVVALNLPGRGLTGRIPAALSRLEQLQELNLSRNRLSGPIPASLGHLTKLEGLNLRHNQLIGDIPTSLAHLPNLKFLSLRANRLTGSIPAELGRKQPLENLVLAGNRFTGHISSTLVNLPTLTRLRLSGNTFFDCAPPPSRPGLDDDFHLFQVESSYCLPLPSRAVGLRRDVAILLGGRDELAGDGKLDWSRTKSVAAWQGLTLADSGFDGIVAIDLRRAGLTGRIPRQFGGLAMLETLRLDGNQLTGPIPAELALLRNLKELGLADNALSGAVPPSLRTRLGLREMRLAGNQLVGWTSMTPSSQPVAASSRCQTTTAIESDLLKDCTTLLALRDTLAGGGTLNWRAVLPLDAWQGVTVGGEPERVTALDLASSGLSGRIPAALGELAGLERLVLSDNALTGAIPRTLGNLPHLVELHLEGNALTGSVPPILAVAADPTRRTNRHRGTAPMTGGSRTHGRGEAANDEPKPANSQYNTFDTPFPAALRDIADHDLPPLCPAIPRAHSELLRDCQNLLNSRDALAGTATLNWSGTIPMTDWQGVQLGGKPVRVTAIELPDAGLAGQLPAALGGLDRLVKLHLQNNRLAGPVPPQLGNLKRLQDLALAHNRLTGRIPATLGALSHLEKVALSGNRFIPPVPPTLRAAEQHDLDFEVFCPASREQAPELFDDCQTLLAVRDPLAGRASLKWRRAAPLGSWTGVRLGGNPVRVQALELPGQALDGHLPPALGSLSALRKLDLSGNALRGELPPSLAQLTQLSELRLAGNRLSGTIPVELTALNLRLLRLANNAFDGPVPTSLRHLPNTDIERVLHCPLVPPTNPGLLDDCGELLALREDLAPDGQLNWSPRLPMDSWQGVLLDGDPLRVMGLHLPGQGLGGQLPAALGNLSRLVTIDFSFNDLEGRIPAALGELSRLRFLALGQNRLTGPVPTELGQLARLEALDLSTNRLTGHISDTLGGLSELVTLRLKENLFLDCSAPTGVASAIIDHDLDVAFLCHPPHYPGLARDAAALLTAQDALAGDEGILNWHRGTPMPAWEGVTLSYGPRPRVVGLDLSAKSLTGRIPAVLGDLTELNTLHLDANALGGAVPPELGNLKHLESLKLNGNLLSGSLPQTLGGLTALKMLRLSGNQFDGWAPTALRQIADHDLGFGPRCPLGKSHTLGLERDCGILLAVRDALAGAAALNWSPAAPIDMWRGVVLGGEPPRVIALHLIDSGLSGSIPPRLGELDALLSLRLSRNTLSGTIPATLGKLSNLTELLLGDNALTGRIPGELGDLTSLTSLRLRKNRLEGPIPAELGRLHNLRELAVDGNALSGRIPHTLTKLSALEALWLAGNDLTDTAATMATAPALAQVVRDASTTPQAAVPTVAAAANAPAAPAPHLESVGFTPMRSPPLGADLFCTQEGAGTPELWSDCRRLLLTLKSVGYPAVLNWRQDVPIGKWRGIGLGGTAPRVTSVDLSGLGLRANIQRSLMELRALEVLRLAHNEFFGPIPSRLGRLKALRELDLAHNNLTGSVPLSIENFKALTDLRLNHNALTGHLVGKVDVLPKLSTMRLGGNDFLGCMPEPVRGIGDRLLELDLECGPTPWSKPPLFEDAATLMASRDALAGGTSLDWSYDAPVSRWQGVTVDGSPPRVVALNLAHAGLSGRIPSELGALSALTRLNLSGNALTGTVPPELGRLAYLRELSLAANKLTGELPEALGHLHHLERFELEGNGFVGCPPEGLRYRDRRRSALLPLTLRHCPTVWQYRQAGQIGGTLYSIARGVDQGTEEHLAEGAHNLFLQIGLQTGLVGVGALGLLCMSLIFNLRSRLGRKVTPVQCLAAAGTAMAITHSAFDIFLLQYVMTVAVFVWMFLGLGTGLANTQLADAPQGNRLTPG